jgi:dsDNA-specific endonuclease/ATPase MutS2
MVNAGDLWVGDQLRLLKSGRVGRFVNVNEDGRIRIEVGDKIVLAKPHMIEQIEEKEYSQKLIDLKEKELEKQLGFKQIEKQIDLHIENLNPNLSNALPERIIDVQLKSFEDYMNDVLKNNLKFVTIIHGKGKGVLKAAIHTHLAATSEVNHFITVNNGGATEVFLK